MRRFDISRTAAALAAAMLCAGAWATDIDVPAGQPTIQAGIDAAVAGDRVLVAPGTYFEHIDFHGKDIQVLGTAGPRETVIDGMRSGVVATFQSGESRGALLSGFTIQHGQGGKPDVPVGGGVRITGASPTISGNVISHNRGCSGAGVGIDGGAALVTGNTIDHNVAHCGDGGGVYVDNATVTISINVFDSNSTPGWGGGIAVVSAGGTAAISRNLVHRNSAGSGGGGIALLLDGGQYGLDDNVVSDNEGGGLHVKENTATSVVGIINNTIADNRAGAPDLTLRIHGLMDLHNNLVRTSLATHAIDCDVRDGGTQRLGWNAWFGGDVVGNCDAWNPSWSFDPQFLGSGKNPYQLLPNSPAIDKANQEFDYGLKRDARGKKRWVGFTEDLGAYEYQGD